MKLTRAEERIIKRILPELEERLTYRVIKRVFKSIEKGEIYPPESMFKKEFIESVKEAEKRVKKGKGRKFKNVKELENFLNSLKR